MNSKELLVDDSQLNTPPQLAIQSAVRLLPDEPLSMAWRSSLNEQLLLVAAKQRKKRRLFWVASPLAGVSLATAMAVIVLIHPTIHAPKVVPTQSLETAILSDHHKSALSNDVTSAGLNLNEVTSDANSSPPEDGVWTEADVESL